MAVRLVACAVKQREERAPAQIAEQLENVGLVRELGAVSFAESAPPPRVVTVPAAQLGARRRILQPEIGRCFLTAKAARPEPVYQNAYAVAYAGSLVDPL
jgi:hypothetical protein